MPKVIRPRRQVLNPDQIPLITPNSTWSVPSELPSLRGVTELALDTEERDGGLASGRGPGWVFRDGYVAGVGVSWREGPSLHKMYVPIRHPDTENFPKEQVAAWLRDITRDRRVIFYNAGYDIGWLKTDLDVEPPKDIDDASCAAFLIDENREDLSLDGVCAWRGVEGKDTAALQEAAVIYGVPKKDAVANLWRLPARYAGPYGEQDPASTLLALEDMRPELARQGLLRAYQTEMRLVPIIHAMRRRGIRIDIDRATRLGESLHARGDLALKELNKRLGGTQATLESIRSRDWLVRTFSNENVEYFASEDTGEATFNKAWMRRAEHWLPRLIAEAKQCHETADKFVKSYLLDFTHLGRVHASINQWKYEEGGTRSHRLSYADPPLQQAPSRPEPFEGWPLTGEIAVEYRQCFLPESGGLWFSPDYSQQEYRHIVNDAALKKCDKAREAVELYQRDPKTDFHGLVVNWTGLPRRHAKDCNFAKAFGAGIPKFASMISKTVEEAGEIMGTYDEELPFVKQLNQLCDKLAQRRGYIMMYDGARSHFDQWESAWLSKEERNRGYREHYRMGPCSLEEAQLRASSDGHPWNGKRLKRAFCHKAMNRRIQGNAARQMKEAMVVAGEEVDIPLLQMHDELSFSLSADASGEKAGGRIVEIMKTVYECQVPFLVDAEWGVTWGDAKHTFGDAVASLNAMRKKTVGGRRAKTN
jgi:DNA polymerase I-like protein with 3'-5' exonuclease and polymerase domains